MKYVLSLLIFVCLSCSVEASFPEVDEKALFPSHRSSKTVRTILVSFETVLYSPGLNGTIVPQRLSFPPRTEEIQVNSDGILHVSEHLPNNLLNYLQETLSGNDAPKPLSKDCILNLGINNEEITVRFPLFTPIDNILLSIHSVYSKPKL